MMQTLTTKVITGSASKNTQLAFLFNRLIVYQNFTIVYQNFFKIVFICEKY